jgi:hypothetical protein
MRMRDRLIALCHHTGGVNGMSGHTKALRAPLSPVQWGSPL